MTRPWNPKWRLSDAEFRALSTAERKALIDARVRARSEARGKLRLVHSRALGRHERKFGQQRRRGRGGDSGWGWAALLVPAAFAAAWVVTPSSGPVRSVPAADGAAAVRASFGACKWGGGSNCVVDGDTIYLGGQKIRIAGIDAPETHDFGCDSELALGERAAERLRELVNSGTVTLTSIDRDEDRYGRKLRNVAVDGRDVGEVLVSEGLARDYGSGRRSWC